MLLLLKTTERRENLIDALKVIGMQNYSLSEKMTVDGLIHLGFEALGSPNLISNRKRNSASDINTVIISHNLNLN